MGARMSANLVRAGHNVTVWNRDPGKADALKKLGARFAANPRDAAGGADVVIAMVRDDPASSTVWLAPDTGALLAMASGAIAIDCSTLTMAHVKRLAATAAARGIAFLDAPVAGSRPQADAGQLIFMVGGTSDDLDRARPILGAMGGAIHYAGATGSGAAVKLAVNTLFAAQVAVLAELIGMLEKAGVDVARAVEIIAATPVASPAAKSSAASMLSGAFAPLFPVELVEKDIGYAEAAASAAGAAAPLVVATRAVLADAIRRGLGNDNLTGVVKAYTART